MNDDALAHAAPELSVVIPALNEQDNVAPLVEQLKQALVDQGIDTQVIIVDDGSTDDTLPRLRALANEYAWLEVLHRDEPRGQSAAMHAGILHASGRHIATLDADLQNDPADLARMLSMLKEQDVDMVQGDRSAARKDNWVRRYGSIVGRKARAWIVGDPTRDTGCSARVIKATFARRLPLQFKGMHRFIPAYAKLCGARVAEMPVTHRPRNAGETKYGLGITKRALPGLIDCFAVRWMMKRIRDVDVRLVTSDESERT